MNDITKSRLVDALLEAEGVELENTKCVSVPSNAFSRRIQRIAEHPEKYTKKRRVKKIVIILIAAAIILTGCTAIKPVRTTIANFIISIFNAHSFVDKNMEKNSNDRITEYYSPKFIPEGYEIVEDEINKISEDHVISRDIKYEKDGKELYFTQLTEKANITFNTENTELNSFSINNIECLYYSNLGLNDYLWEQNGYRFILSVPDEINLETAKKIIESVKIIELTNN